MAKGQSLQDPFLNALRKEHVPVSIYLVNGIKLQGQIDSFDQFVVLLKNTVSQMVYKHAISTVVPARAVRLAVEEGAVAEACGGMMRRRGQQACSSARAPVSAPCSCASGLAMPVKREDLEEFEQLARSAGAHPVATITGRRERPDPRYFVGSGKAAGDRQRGARRRAPKLILVDHPLSPSQQRNLEQLERRARARSQRPDPGHLRAARAQLRGQAGGRAGAAQAPVQPPGARLDPPGAAEGRHRHARRPGETQLETDRRLLGARMRSVTRRLERLKQQRDTGRSARAEIPVPSVALVGYTNAGKSTLFNALTGSEVYIADQLFATLDPTVRRLRLPGGAPVVLADTVGFIRELPHELVAAFQSTLQEAREAHLLLHVVDASDPRRDEHIAPGRHGAQRDRRRRHPAAAGLQQDRSARARAAARARCAMAGRARVWICCGGRAAGLELLREAIAERLDLNVQRAVAASAAGRRGAARAAVRRRRGARRARARGRRARAAGGTAGGGAGGLGGAARRAAAGSAAAAGAGRLCAPRAVPRIGCRCRRPRAR